MTTELMALAWGCVLGLVHIFVAAHVRTRQYGVHWNVGPRDEAVPPPTPLVGRLERAQANFFETFPIVVAAVLIVQVAGLNNRWTALGAILWLAARIVYLPLYALGVPVARTLVFSIGFAGLVMMLVTVLR